MENLDHNTIKESTKSLENSRPSFEIDKVEAVQIAEELSIISNAIDHNSPIRVEDLDSFNGLAKNTKINVGGEMMTVEEAEKIPDLKMNTKIWKEMSEGNFDNTSKLTRITPRFSKFLEKVDDIRLTSLITSEGLVLPKFVEGCLFLDSLTSVRGLVLPEHVGESLVLSGLVSGWGLVLPELVEDDLILTGLVSAAGLTFPKSVGRNLYLNRLRQSWGLTLPQQVGRDLYLTNLQEAEGLVLPQTIGGTVDLSCLNTNDINRLKFEYPQHSDKL